MPHAVNAGHASGKAATTTLMHARTPDALVPENSRLTLTLSGAWEAADGSEPDSRSGRVVIALPPGPQNATRPALAATLASQFSDADGGSSDFSYSVSWNNLTAMRPGDQLTVLTQTRGGRFTQLLAKVEIVWIASQQQQQQPQHPAHGHGKASPSPVAAPSPSPTPGGALADESTTVVATPAPVHFSGKGLTASASNLTFWPLLNFTVPPAFNPLNNYVELWTRGEWVADSSAAAGAPLGVVGVAYNGTLLAYAVASHYTDHAGRSASFSFGTRFGNVSLPAGAVAEIWAGMRAGHFRALSASASLTWSPAEGDATLPASSDGDAAQNGALSPAIEQKATVAMANTRTFAAPAKTASKPNVAAILNFTAPPGERGCSCRQRACSKRLMYDALVHLRAACPLSPCMWLHMHPRKQKHTHCPISTHN
jgi:hypothetical protein